MPRNGSGIYSKPAGTTAIPNTTIASGPFNSLADDLVADANAVRPIGAGGTGAANAADACTNLGAVKVSAGTAANLTMTTKATFPAHTGEVSIATGTGDGASYTTYTSALKIWNGLGLLDNAGAVKGYWDARNGVLDTKGGFKVDGQSIDDRFAKLAGASFTGNVTTTGNVQATGNVQSSAEIIANATTPTIKLARPSGTTWKQQVQATGEYQLIQDGVGVRAYSKTDGTSGFSGNVSIGAAVAKTDGDIDGTKWTGLLSDYLDDAFGDVVRRVRLGAATVYYGTNAFSTDAPSVVTDCYYDTLPNVVVRKTRVLQTEIPALGWVNVSVV